MPAPGPRRTLAVAAIGNVVEWYDWNAYLIFAVLLGGHFFPSGSPVTRLLGTLAVFAVGFFFRPLGGALLGSFSDRYGRRTALTLSVFLMAGGSLLIAVAPTYATIGVAAPLLLVLARAVQGLSAGGEVAAMSTYVIEIAPPDRRGRYASAIYASTTAGTLLAVGVAATLRVWLTPAELQAWGWRIPFALGAVLGLYGWYLRRRLAETAVFRAGSRVSRPTLHVLRHHRSAALRVVGFTVGITVVYYTFAVYLSTYAQLRYGIPAGAATWATLAAQCVFLAALPVCGRLCDRWGRRPLLLIFGVGFTVLSPVFFAVLGANALALFAVQALALVLFATCATAAPVAMLELFPTNVRSAGIGLPYSLSVAVFGGTAPYVVQWLTEHGLGTAYPWYVSALCLVSTVTFALTRETRDTALDQPAAGAEIALPVSERQAGRV